MHAVKESIISPILIPSIYTSAEINNELDSSELYDQVVDDS